MELFEDGSYEGGDDGNRPGLQPSRPGSQGATWSRSSNLASGDGSGQQTSGSGASQVAVVETIETMSLSDLLAEEAREEEEETQLLRMPTARERAAADAAAAGEGESPLLLVSRWSAQLRWQLLGVATAIVAVYHLRQWQRQRAAAATAEKAVRLTELVGGTDDEIDDDDEFDEFDDGMMDEYAFEDVIDDEDGDEDADAQGYEVEDEQVGYPTTTGKQCIKSTALQSLPSSCRRSNAKSGTQTGQIRGGVGAVGWTIAGRRLPAGGQRLAGSSRRISAGHGAAGSRSRIDRPKATEKSNTREEQV